MAVGQSGGMMQIGGHSVILLSRVLNLDGKGLKTGILMYEQYVISWSFLLLRIDHIIGENGYPIMTYVHIGFSEESYI